MADLGGTYYRTLQDLKRFVRQPYHIGLGDRLFILNRIIGPTSHIIII